MTLLRSHETELTVIGTDTKKIEKITDQILNLARRRNQPPSGNPVIVLLDSTALQTTKAQNSFLNQDTQLVLNLEDIGLVRIASQTNHPISWFCSQDPKKIVGQLLDGFRGAYWKAAQHQFIYQTDMQAETYLPGPFLSLEKPQDLHLAAAICATRTTGISPDVIREYLKLPVQPPSERYYENPSLIAP